MGKRIQKRSSDRLRDDDGFTDTEERERRRTEREKRLKDYRAYSALHAAHLDAALGY